MCSSAVKTRVVQILLILVSTVLAAALQDMLPAFGGAKAPILLALVLHWSFTERKADERDRHAQKVPFLAARWVPAAIFAGAFEDALSGFPTGCATGFFLLAGAAIRFLRTLVGTIEIPVLGLIVLMAAAPLHELWLGVWGVVGEDPALFVRFFASALPAAPVGMIVFSFMPSIERHAGFEGPSAAGRIA